MLIDESKMVVDSSVCFLNCGKQHTNLKLGSFYLRLSKIAPLKLIAIDQFRSHKHRYTISAKLPTKVISRAVELLRILILLEYYKRKTRPFILGKSSRISQKNRYYVTIEKGYEVQIYQLQVVNNQVPR